MRKTDKFKHNSKAICSVSATLYNVWIIIFSYYSFIIRIKFKLIQGIDLRLLHHCVNNQEFHRQKISKGRNDPNGSITQLDLINIMEQSSKGRYNHHKLLCNMHQDRPHFKLKMLNNWKNLKIIIRYFSDKMIKFT